MRSPMEKLDQVYRARLQRLASERQRTGNSVVITRQISIALANTKLCIATLQEFQNAILEAARAVDDERSKAERQRKVLEENIHKMETLQPKLIDQDLRESQEHVIAISKKGLESVTTLYGKLFDFYGFFFAVNRDVVVDRLSQLFGAQRERDAYYAVKAFLEYLIGLSPAGPLLAVFETVKSMVEGQQAIIPDAVDYVASLETYNSAATLWCITSQLLIDNMRFPPRESAVTVDDAANAVNQRFKQLLDQSKKETKP